MKKIATISLIILLTVLVIGKAPVLAKNFDLDVESAILIEAETGQVLYEKNPDKRVPPASITKVMALLIAMEQIEKGKLNLEDKVSVSRYAESMGGSQIFLPANIRLKVKELLKAVTIASANDASVALAEAIAGTYGNFIDLMNEKADEMGLENTHFLNSTGLPEEGDNHYSSARDIALMAKELVKYDKIREWASTWLEYVPLPNRRAMLVNTNKLIKKYPGLDGLKTGHTSEAGFCLAATAKQSKMRLISVVLDAKTETAREEITTRLLDYGFNGFRKEVAIKKGSEINNINVPSGKKTVTTAQAAANLPVVMQRGSEDDTEVKTILNEDIKAPIKKGDVLGKNVLTVGGQKVGEVKLLATENIEKANIFVRLWRSFVNWIGSWLQNL